MLTDPIVAGNAKWVAACRWQNTVAGVGVEYEPWAAETAEAADLHVVAFAGGTSVVVAAAAACSTGELAGVACEARLAVAEPGHAHARTVAQVLARHAGTNH
jgi:hypothetical protein